VNIFTRTPPSGFYVVGGTLRGDARCYVQRQADFDLFNGLMSGKFCYVLTPRQMGKSSLMIRTAERLRDEGVGVAVLDLTAAGQNLNVEQWYGGLLMQMGQQLCLEDELLEFWQSHSLLSPLQRWMTAVRKIVLPRYLGRLIIFVDEIDAVRSLHFSTDEFFAGIREFYNRRTQDEELERLAFCLLGVATPSDLIRDTRTTPFNIGQRIELNDFTETEARPLAQGLNRDPQTNELFLKRVLYWTNGHPYLTQHLCQTIAENRQVKTENDVDRLCQELFLSARARERDDNLLFVRERLLRSKEVELAALLELFGRIHRQSAVQYDENNRLFSVLQLSGITRVDHGALVVRNRIYAKAFNQEWIKSNRPDAEARRQRAAFRRGAVRTGIIALIISAAISLLAVYAFQQRNRASEQEAANRKLLYSAQMNLAGQAWDNANITRLTELLERHVPLNDQEDMRGFEWCYYWRLLHRARTSLQHDSMPTSVAFSPDGKLLATAGSDHLIYLWDASTGQPLAKLSGHTQKVWKVVFSPDGNKLASAGWDGTARVWDVNARLEIKTLTGHTGNVSGLAFSPDGSKLATGSWDKQIKLWNVSTGKELTSFNGHANWVWSVAFSPDGQRLASTSEDHTVRLWNVETFREEALLTGHGASVYSSTFSPDGKLLATSSNNGNVKIWNTRTLEETANLTGHSFSVYSVAFSPDGTRLASAGVDRIVRVWDIASAKEIARIKGHRDEIRGLGFSPDGRTIATASDDLTVKLWDAGTNDQPDTLLHNQNFIDSLCFSPDGRIVVTANKSVIAFWDVMTGKMLFDIPTESIIYDLSFSPDGKYIAASHRDNTVTLWDVINHNYAGVFIGHTDITVTVSFSPDSQRLATGSRDHLIKIWNVADQSEIATLSGHHRRVSSLAFSPDGKFLATGSDDKTVKLWDVIALRVVKTMEGHSNEIWAVAFSPDGNKLGSGSYDRTVKIWNWRTGVEILTLKGHSAGVKSLAFSPDGKRLATGSEDRTIKLWDVGGGNELATFHGHTAIVTSLAFSPNGSILASAGRDFTVRLWRASDKNRE
jgi:WD40 repeat protein